MPHSIKALILDMDGVIWKADAPIGDLPRIFDQIHMRGLKFVFATNNSTQTPEQYTARLRGFGLQVDNCQVLTSSLGAASALATKFRPGAKVFMIGEAGLRLALEQRGFEILPLENVAEAQAVVMGMDREISFHKIAEATLLVGKGIPFYATNSDRTFPTPRGEIPGAGAWLSVITTASGVQPVIAGKPFPYLMELAMETLGTGNAETLVVGDRIETDIAAGQAVGCPTALVLSGVSTRARAESWQPAIDFIANDLSALVQSL